jgi:hypothetical protein
MPLLPKKANCEGNNETLGDRSPLPAGSYIVAMKTSDYKETKSKNGHYLSVMFVVIEGPHKGRTLFTNLNLDNPNPVAVEIAYKELNSICEACGMAGVEDSAELYGIPLVVDVKVDKKENSDFPPGNSITNYRKPEGEARRSVFQDATEEQPAATATEKPKKKKPWEK